MRQWCCCWPRCACDASGPEMQRIRVLIWKELIELREDPRLFGIVVLAPILQLFLLAYAATTDIRDVPVAIVDADRSAASRELVRRFDASPSFTVTDIQSSPDAIDQVIERGTAWLAIVVPRGYQSALEGGGSQAVQIVADGSDANSAGVALSYATNLIAGYGQELAATHALARGVASASSPSIQPVVRVWFNPRLESRDFMVPGIVALLLLVVTTNLSSMGIVREKEVGTLEQLSVTPLTR